MRTPSPDPNPGGAGESRRNISKAVPPAVAVELWPHDPAWGAEAEKEAARVAAQIGGLILCIHHIGSTAIPHIRAKPILDLLPVVRSLSQLDDARAALADLGYSWWGEYGLEGRRYCTFDDPQSSRRKVQLHCFEEGSREISRLLAFRDYLRAIPALAREYEAEKARCGALHPDDSNAYSACKGDWIARVVDEALAAGGDS